jgi:hypothetical protein
MKQTKIESERMINPEINNNKKKNRGVARLKMQPRKIRNPLCIEPYSIQLSRSVKLKQVRDPILS